MVERAEDGRLEPLRDGLRAGARLEGGGDGHRRRDGHAPVHGAGAGPRRGVPAGPPRGRLQPGRHALPPADRQPPRPGQQPPGGAQQHPHRGAPAPARARRGHPRRTWRPSSSSAWRRSARPATTRRAPWPRTSSASSMASRCTPAAAGPWYRLRKKVRKHRAAVAMGSGALVLVSLVAGAGRPGAPRGGPAGAAGQPVHREGEGHREPCAPVPPVTRARHPRGPGDHPRVDARAGGRHARGR